MHKKWGGGQKCTMFFFSKPKVIRTLSNTKNTYLSFKEPLPSFKNDLFMTILALLTAVDSC